MIFSVLRLVNIGYINVHKKWIQAAMNMKHICIKRQLIPYNFRAYQYLKIEVRSKVAPFLKSAHNLFNYFSFEQVCRACAQQGITWGGTRCCERIKRNLERNAMPEVLQLALKPRDHYINFAQVHNSKIPAKVVCCVRCNIKYFTLVAIRMHTRNSNCNVCIPGVRSRDSH